MASVVVTAWPEVALKELMAQDTAYISEVEPRMYPKLSVKWWGKGAVLDTPADGASVRMSRHQLAKAGQVIVSEIWAKHGSIGIVPQEGAGALITSHFFLFDIDTTRLLPKYMDYLIQANYLTSLLADIAQGTTSYAAIRPQQFLSVEIPLPPLEEQRRIVGRIEALAERIAEARGLRRAAMAEAEGMWSSVMEQALAKTKGSEVRLVDILREDSLNGLSVYPSSEPPGTPILRISAGTSRSDAVVDETDFRYLEVSDAIIAKYRLETGDLLACRFNGNLSNVGKFALYQGYAGITHIYPDKLIRFRVDQKRANPAYISLAMNSRSVRENVESFCATTAGNIGISAGNLKTVWFPLPALHEQDQIVAAAQAIYAQIADIKRHQAETAAELDALLPSALDRAFRGEL